MPNFKKLYRQSKPYSRRVYKATGLANPFKRGKLSSTRLIKDVAKIKALINVEKKKYQMNNTVGTPLTCGQVYVNASGAQIVDITPTPQSGSADNARTGNSIKMTSFYHSFQISQQSAANHQNMKIIVEYWNVKGIPQAATQSTLLKIYEANNFMNPLGGYIDYFSSRNPDYFNTFKRIASKSFTLQFDSTTGASGNESLSRGCIKRKFNHHIRYDPGTTTVIEGQILMTIRADSGNRGGTDYTDTGFIPVKQANTGANLQYNMIDFYVDN